MSLTLPEAIQQKVAAMRETSYGVNRVTLVLKDGRRVFDADIAWANEIARIGGRAVKEESQLGFSLREIVDVTQ
jgi:hypothetical protein